MGAERTSSETIRPPGPLPEIPARSTPSSAATRRALGDANLREPSKPDPPLALRGKVLPAELARSSSIAVVQISLPPMCWALIFRPLIRRRPSMFGLAPTERLGTKRMTMVTATETSTLTNSVSQVQMTSW